MASTEAIKVNIRVRPLNAREKSSASCYARFRAVGGGALAEYEASGKQKASTRAEFDNGESFAAGRTGTKNNVLLRSLSQFAPPFFFLFVFPISPLFSARGSRQIRGKRKLFLHRHSPTR